MINLLKGLFVLSLICIMSGCGRTLRGLPPDGKAPNHADSIEKKDNGKKKEQKQKLPDPEKMPMNMSL